MASAMHIIIAIAAFRDIIADDSVQLSARHASLRCIEALELCLQNDVINILLPRIRLAHNNRACHIRMVALIDSAKVKGNKITLGNNLVRSHTMRQSAACTRSNNRIKRRLLTAQHLHVKFQTSGQTTLSAANLNIIKKLDKGFVGNAGCFEQIIQLLLILYHADIAEIDALHIRLTQENVQSHIVVIAVISTVEANNLRISRQLGSSSPDAVCISRLILQHLKMLQLVLRLFSITTICNQNSMLSVKVKQA